MKVLILSAVALLSSCSAGNSDRSFAKVANTEACVKICVADYVNDGHVSGESWGTGTSSMPFAQQDTLKYLRGVCSEIYEFSCFVGYGWGDTSWVIHKDGSNSAGTVRTMRE